MAQPLGDSYQLDELVATTSLGELWRGHDLMGRRVAVTVLSPERLQPPQPGAPTGWETASQRFWMLRQQWSALPSGIVPVRDLVVDGSRHALVSEWIDDAEPLDRALTDYGAMPGPDLCSFGAQIASALATLHEAGLTHGNLTTANILVDFSSGKPTPHLVGLGDAALLGIRDNAFEAPELRAGGEVTQASDLYSLGLVLVSMQSGRFPVPGAVDAALMSRFSRQEGTVDQLGEPTWQLITALTERDPGRRGTARAAVGTLTGAGGVRPPAIPTPESWSPDDPWATQRLPRIIDPVIPAWVEAPAAAASHSEQPIVSHPQTPTLSPASQQVATPQHAPAPRHTSVPSDAGHPVDAADVDAPMLGEEDADQAPRRRRRWWLLLIIPLVLLLAWGAYLVGGALAKPVVDPSQQLPGVVESSATSPSAEAVPTETTDGNSTGADLTTGQPEASSATANTPTPTDSPSSDATATVTPAAGTFPDGVQSCGDKVGALDGTTSCEFALAVAKAADSQVGSGTSFTIEAVSPVTQKSYEMTCTPDATWVSCTGGSNAQVYLIP